MTNNDGKKSEINSYSTTFLNKRGKKIFAKYWESPQAPRASVFICHGYAEHCLPYDRLAKSLALKGFFVFAHDHVGHGQSGGSRVHIDTFKHYVQDVFQHMDIVTKKFPNLPIFLCGHSMGGAVSILTALEKPDAFKGVVLIAPAIATNPEVVTPLKMTVARILGWVLPHFPVAPLNFSDACSCPENVKTMNEDPLRYHGYCKAGFGSCLMDACQEIQDKAPSITFPFFLLHAGEDKICDEVGAKTFYETAPVKDKLFKLYPKAYHALLQEPNGIAEQVTEDIIEWISTHV